MTSGKPSFLATWVPLNNTGSHLRICSRSPCSILKDMTIPAPIMWEQRNGKVNECKLLRRLTRAAAPDWLNETAGNNIWVSVSLRLSRLAYAPKVEIFLKLLIFIHFLRPVSRWHWKLTTTQEKAKKKIVKMLTQGGRCRRSRKPSALFSDDVIMQLWEVCLFLTTENNKSRSLDNLINNLFVYDSGSDSDSGLWDAARFCTSSIYLKNILTF